MVGAIGRCTIAVLVLRVNFLHQIVVNFIPFAPECAACRCKEEIPASVDSSPISKNSILSLFVSFTPLLRCVRSRLQEFTQLLEIATLMIVFDLSLVVLTR